MAVVERFQRNGVCGVQVPDQEFANRAPSHQGQSVHSVN